MSQVINTGSVANIPS